MKLHEIYSPFNYDDDDHSSGGRTYQSRASAGVGGWEAAIPKKPTRVQSPKTAADKRLSTITDEECDMLDAAVEEYNRLKKPLDRLYQNAQYGTPQYKTLYHIKRQVEMIGSDLNRLAATGHVKAVEARMTAIKVWLQRAKSAANGEDVDLTPVVYGVPKVPTGAQAKRQATQQASADALHNLSSWLR